MRTLIPFQAVSPLQKQNKRDGFRKQTHLLGKHTSCLALDCLSSNSAQRETENLLRSPKVEAEGRRGERGVIYQKNVGKHPLHYKGKEGRRVISASWSETKKLSLPSISPTNKFAARKRCGLRNCRDITFVQSE